MPFGGPRSSVSSRSPSVGTSASLARRVLIGAAAVCGDPVSRVLVVCDGGAPHGFTRRPPLPANLLAPETCLRGLVLVSRWDVEE